MNRALAKKINQMAKKDQEMRKSFEKDGALRDRAIDRKNTRELKKIIKKYGWPTIPLVGRKASFNAWLLAQHADHDGKFQESARKILIAIDGKQRGAINRAHIAYLTDRLLVAKKRPQIFGTQFYFDGHRKLKLNLLKSKRGINKLRKEYNLPALERFLEGAREYNAKKK